MLIVSILLMINAINDLKNREIYLFTVVLMAVVGVVRHTIVSDWSWEILVAILPGLAFLVCSLLFRESVGFGDGLVLIALGFCISIEKLFTTLWISSVVCGCYGLYCFLIQKKEYNYEIPFVPCLWVGYICTVFIPWL